MYNWQRDVKATLWPSGIQRGAEGLFDSSISTLAGELPSVGAIQTAGTRRLAVRSTRCTT